MATPSITYATREPAAHPCACGCKECPGTCCTLQCLERPRFFCGQLLTDQDLTALVTWTQDHLRLGRYRHGWGVVCGLDVRCGDAPYGDASHPAKETASVIVSPGYAVSCCGDDVVVCEDTRVDLSMVCRDDKDPCAELRPDEPGVQTIIGCWEGDAREVRIVDLLLTGRDEAADPHTALGRSGCKEAAPCEYGRTRESAALHWRLAANGEPVDAPAVKQWQAGYDACLKLLSSFADSPAVFGADIAGLLNTWINTHPLHDFCFLQDCICRLRDEPEVAADRVVKLLFWLMQDCRNAFLGCDCHGCGEDAAVPLARVWLWSRMEGGKRRCRVLRIDSRPPYRRPLRSDCWPAPRGEVNIGRAIWLREEEARCVLADLGLRVQSVDVQLLSALDSTALRTAFEGTPFVLCGSDIQLHLVDPEDGSGARVVSVSGPRAIEVIQPSVTIKPQAPKPPSAVDDLTSITNIGPSRAERLRQADVLTYAQLAAIPTEKLRVLFPTLVDDMLNGWKKEAQDKIG